MSTLFLIGLKNFNIYQTNADMQAAEFDMIVPGALVYSVESGSPYYFDNNLANQLSTSFLSDTGEGYWVLYTGDWILVEGSAQDVSVPLFYGDILIGNLDNIGAPQSVSGAISLSPTGVSTLADGVITTNKIVDQAVTGDKIGLNTITGSNIISNTITGSNIALNTITGSNIALGTITGTLIANNTITNTNIANATIIGTNIADGAVTADKISLDNGYIIVGNTNNFGVNVLVSGAISISETGVTTLNDDSINTNAIADGAVTYNKLSSDIQYPFRVVYGFTTTIFGVIPINGIEYDGIVSTDTIIVTPLSLHSASYIIGTEATTNGLVLTFNTAPGVSQLQILVFRAVS